MRSHASYHIPSWKHSLLGDIIEPNNYTDNSLHFFFTPNEITDKSHQKIHTRLVYFSTGVFQRLCSTACGCNFESSRIV